MSSTEKSASRVARKISAKPARGLAAANAGTVTKAAQVASNGVAKGSKRTGEADPSIKTASGELLAKERKAIEGLVRSLVLACDESSVPSFLPLRTGDDQPCPFRSDEGMGVMLWSILVWEAGAEAALGAMARLRACSIDLNELRVHTVEQVQDALGQDYPLCVEHSFSILASLRDVFRREHCLSLKHLVGSGKRAAENYARTIDGLDGFVQDRLLLWAGHAAFGVDSRAMRAMVGSGLLSHERDIEPLKEAIINAPAIGSKAEKLAMIVAGFDAWVDANAVAMAVGAGVSSKSKLARRKGARDGRA